MASESILNNLPRVIFAQVHYINRGDILSKSVGKARGVWHIMTCLTFGDIIVYSLSARKQ